MWDKQEQFPTARGPPAPPPETGRGACVRACVPHLASGEEQPEQPRRRAPAASPGRWPREVARPLSGTPPGAGPRTAAMRGRP